MRFIIVNARLLVKLPTFVASRMTHLAKRIDAVGYSRVD